MSADASVDIWIVTSGNGQQWNYRAEDRFIDSNDQILATIDSIKKIQTL